MTTSAHGVHTMVASLAPTSTGPKPVPSPLSRHQRLMAALQSGGYEPAEVHGPCFADSSAQLTVCRLPTTQVAMPMSPEFSIGP